MKALLFIPLVLLVGCSSNVVKVETSDRYTKLEKVERLKTEAVALPPTPKIEVRSIDGVEYATLDAQGMNGLNAYRQAAKQNTEALGLLLEAHNGLVDQRNLMLENLRLEETRANFYAERYAVSETARRQQYDEFQFELILHKAMVVILGIALVL